MRTRQEIANHRDVTKATLIELEKELARHPDTIKEAFNYNPMWNMDVFEDLISKISFIRWSYPQSLQRTPPEIIASCSYVVDEKIYTFQKNEKNEYIVLDPLRIDKNEEKEISQNIVDSLWDDEDPITHLREKGLKDWEIIGCLLTLTCREN